MMMTINVLRCPRNAGAVANNKRVHASSDRCSSSNSTKNTNTNSRRRKGVVLSSFGKAWKSLFISLFFFFLVLSLRVLGKEKNVWILSSRVFFFFFFFFSEKKIWCFFARARANDEYSYCSAVSSSSAISDRSPRSFARAQRERSSLTRERRKRRQREEERKFSSSLFSLFLSVSYEINQKRDGRWRRSIVWLRKCGCKERWTKRKRGENFFFCSDIHSFSLLSYLQKQGITTRTIKGRYTRTL